MVICGVSLWVPGTRQLVVEEVCLHEAVIVVQVVLMVGCAAMVHVVVRVGAVLCGWNHVVDPAEWWGETVSVI